MPGRREEAAAAVVVAAAAAVGTTDAAVSEIGGDSGRCDRVEGTADAAVGVVGAGAGAGARRDVPVVLDSYPVRVEVGPHLLGHLAPDARALCTIKEETFFF